jgi:hypothetical protein
VGKNTGTVPDRDVPSNYGVVKIDSTPWEALTKRMQQVNAAIESLHAKAATR